MARQNSIHLPQVRKRKAYFTAFLVFSSYYWLSFKSKFLGQKYYERKIKQLHSKNAIRIKKRVDELEGLFIKFGQLISNLSNILPLEFRAPLAELQDHVIAKDFNEIKATIQHELGKDLNEIFSEFDETPIAAASIGQAHKAIYNNEEVVVKIQHKNIDTIAKADLEIIKNLTKIHAYVMDIQGLDHTYEQVKIMIEEELDYTNELIAMNEISENIGDENEFNVIIPATYNELCTKKILVTQFQEGVNISNLATLNAWNVDLNDVAKRLIEIYCQMVLIDGNYHADPHPGNILVNQYGEIVLLDFGATAKLSPATKEAIPELIESLNNNEVNATINALKKLGFIGEDKASRKFVSRLITAFSELVNTDLALESMDFQNVEMSAGLSALTNFLKKIDLGEVSKNLKIPKEYVLLNRTLVLMVGNVFSLSPQLNILNVVRPFIQENIKMDFTDYKNLLVKTIKSKFKTTVALPNELSAFLKQQKESDVENELNTLNKTMKGIQHSLRLLLHLVFIILIVVLFNSFHQPHLAVKIIFGIALSISSLIFLKKLIFK